MSSSPAARPLHSPFVVRAALPAEHAAVGELTVHAYRSAGFLSDDSGYADELRDAAARAASTELLVAADSDGALLGTATLILDTTSRYRELAGPGEAELRMLAVDPATQGRGVGQALVVDCLDRAARAGRSRFVLSSGPGMRRAHRLYEQLGFRRTPERDWEPMPGFVLLTYALDLAGSAV